MNSVNITGRLTKDVKMAYTSGDNTAIAKFTVAVDRMTRDKGADFIPVTVFGKQAENCGRYLAKGRMVAVAGRIQTGSYEKSDGTRVYTTDVIASNVEFLGGKEEKQESVPTFAELETDLPF